MSDTKKTVVSRRQVLKAAAGGAVLVSAGPLRQARAADTTVRVYGVNTSTLKAGWDAFTEQTGLTMEYTETTADLGVFIREVVANEIGEVYDFFIIDIGMQRKLGPEGYFLQVDENHPQLTNWKTVEEGYKGSIMVEEGGGQVAYGVPNMFNADSFGFWPDALGVNPQDTLDWSYMFENERTMGRAGVDTSWAQSMTHIAMYVKATGKVDVKDNTDLTPEEAKAVMDWAIERKRAGQFRTFFSGFDEQVHLLGTQEVDCRRFAKSTTRKARSSSTTLSPTSTSSGATPSTSRNRRPSGATSTTSTRRSTTFSAANIAPSRREIAVMAVPTCRWPSSTRKRTTGRRRMSTASGTRPRRSIESTNRNTSGPTPSPRTSTSWRRNGSAS